MARFDELQDYGQVPGRGKNSIHFRRVDMGGGLEVLDIRTHIDSGDYTGWTKKGVQIPVDQLEAVKRIVAGIKE